MHVPDGFLDLKTAAAMGVISAAGLGVALRQARLSLPPRRVPLMGLAAAFIFAAQMLNFPVSGGTSGHVVGAVLAAVLLGPGPAVVVISAVLIVQALLFSDGGITALGANVFNMALIGAVGGWVIYRVVRSALPGLRGQVVAASFAAWSSIVWAAVACSAELALSGKVRWSVVFPVMTHVHMVIGIGEALVTGLVLASIARTRPDLMRAEETSAPPRYRELSMYGLLISLALALFVSPFASKSPDGLNHSVEVLGFANQQVIKPMIAAPAASYRIPGIGSETIATSIAGAIGTIVVFGLALGLARVLVPKIEPATADSQIAGS